jgi:hypothetical protein
MSEKLLACVCFHYLEERIPHLQGVVDNFLLHYPESRIIIDTNSRHSEKAVSEMFGENTRVQIFVHENLQDPFHLAWVHRRHFKRELEGYDVFMYVEDDILVPRDGYLNYLDVFPKMWPEFIPSFVRTEEKDGILYCADAFVRTRVRRSDIVQIDGRSFVTLDNPYHAFWVMPRKELKESMNNNFDKIHDGKKWIREIAASYGLMPGHRPNVRWESYDIQKKGLVEVDEKMRILPICHVKHTTNKYINDWGFNFGKIRLDRVIKEDAKLL